MIAVVRCAVGRGWDRRSITTEPVHMCCNLRHVPLEYRCPPAACWHAPLDVAHDCECILLVRKNLACLYHWNHKLERANDHTIRSGALLDEDMEVLPVPHAVGQF